MPSTRCIGVRAGFSWTCRQEVTVAQSTGYRLRLLCSEWERSNNEVEQYDVERSTLRNSAYSNPRSNPRMGRLVSVFKCFWMVGSSLNPCKLLTTVTPPTMAWKRSSVRSRPSPPLNQQLTRTSFLRLVAFGSKFSKSLAGLH